MRKPAWALALFLLGYLIASVVGYGLYLVHPVAMWVGVFTLMLLVFGGLAYVYFARLPLPLLPADAAGLAAMWIVLSFFLDGLIYIAVLPAAFGGHANWTFFADQSPWIWLCYAALALIIGAAYLLCKRFARKN